MLIYSMGVSVDGFIADREGAFDWTVPSDELFRFHLARVRELGLGRSDTGRTNRMSGGGSANSYEDADSPVGVAT